MTSRAAAACRPPSGRRSCSRCSTGTAHAGGEGRRAVPERSFLHVKDTVPVVSSPAQNVMSLPPPSLAAFTRPSTPSWTSTACTKSTPSATVRGRAARGIGLRVAVTDRRTFLVTPQVRSRATCDRTCAHPHCARTVRGRAPANERAALGFGPADVRADTHTRTPRISDCSRQGFFWLMIPSTPQPFPSSYQRLSVFLCSLYGGGGARGAQPRRPLPAHAGDGQGAG